MQLHRRLDRIDNHETTRTRWINPNEAEFEAMLKKPDGPE